MNYRVYNPKKDRKACLRIWQECSWIDSSKEEAAAFDILVEGCRALVADLNGEAECLVLSIPGVIRYLDEELALSVVTNVTTSRIARKQGLAKRLTAQSIAADVAAGAQVSVLGIFEQGFYNRLGFGSGGYEHRISFDPAQLNINVKARVPRRLDRKKDGASVHAAMLARKRGHGACSLNSDAFIRAEMHWLRDGFGLGYFDGPNGELTHLIWCGTKGEGGSYSVLLCIYQNREQFLELMALVKSWGDQVRMVRMHEPPDIQMQDLIEQPFRYRLLTRKSEFENSNLATAYWQMRICDLPGCLAKTHLRADTVRFNLKLRDPIEKYLPDDVPWRGVSGDYVVTLGPSSGAEPGTDATLPTLTAALGAFTRMWIGVRPATGLAVTDDLVGPPDLLDALDRVLCLPDPNVDWDF